MVGAPSLSSTNGPPSSPRCSSSSSAGASASTTSSISTAAGGEVVSAAARGSGQQVHRRGQRCDGRTLVSRHLVQLQLLGVTGLPLHAISIAALGPPLRPADDLSFNDVSAITLMNVFEDPGRAAKLQSCLLHLHAQQISALIVLVPHRQRQNKQFGSKKPRSGTWGTVRGGAQIEVGCYNA